MFVISLSYKVELAEVEQHIDEHVVYLDKYYAKGHFIASGPKLPRTGGLILAQAESKEALDLIVAEDPFFKAGIADYEVVEFAPTKVAEGVEFLKKFS